MSVDEAAFSQFIKNAKHRGTVSIDELRDAFSIDAMKGEDIATLVLRLEESGILVEIDPALLSPKHNVPLNSPEIPRTQSSQTIGSTSRDSRTSSDFEIAKSGGSLSVGSPVVETSGMGRSKAPPVGKRVVWALMLLVVIALLAIWWLSTG